VTIADALISSVKLLAALTCQPTPAAAAHFLPAAPVKTGGF